LCRSVRGQALVVVSSRGISPWVLPYSYATRSRYTAAIIHSPHHGMPPVGKQISALLPDPFQKLPTAPPSAAQLLVMPSQPGHNLMNEM
jgi:hypothetical protein